MRRGLVHVLAWSLATGAAVTLSWWGVHTVMAGTVYDRPRALPITAADATTQGSKPLASSTQSPKTPPPSKSPSTKPTGKPRTPTPSAKPTTSAPDPSPTSSGQVKSYDTDGGRVVFDIGDASATLVSATPGSGWSMQVWKTETWIRVEFAAGADRVSVFCTWHDGPPRVEIGNY
ncbi:hypothetical protein [Streptomyces chartreusis]|uniref:Secreted protein n=1 Tax=Streptomyces chartreusis TaxID=1969 RepID=A0A7H8TD90_STRCX|nr:hypothetical protein [Streptomyces chartreusis]QKZ21314.1 hypothetical protein HUT05_30650 [Streptomyces chartreusis]